MVHVNAITNAGPIAFIGGGNMARAIIGGLRAADAALRIIVIDPFDAGRSALAAEWGVQAHAAAHDSLRDAAIVVWAVKPQSFAEAAAPCAGLVSDALQLSVMAGVRSDALVQATHTQRIVRAMPNTPALIGLGITGLFARAAVKPTERAAVERVLSATGQWLWFDDEGQLDAVTALSGSGPAYVFYVLEALIAAGERTGLSGQAAKQLALATLRGATELAARSDESPQTLRERVTSKGGTTHAALAVLAQRGVRDAIEEAVVAARDRARAMGDVFVGGQPTRD